MAEIKRKDPKVFRKQAVNSLEEYGNLQNEYLKCGLLKRETRMNEHKAVVSQ